MKVFIIASEFPYPAKHGAKVDILNRLLAFEKINVECFLLAWYPRTQTPADSSIKYISSHVKGLAIFPLKSDIHKIINLIRYPSLVSERMLTKKQYAAVLSDIKKFNPDFILVDSIFGGNTGMRFSKDLGLPLCLRLHNIEHVYMHGQYQLASGLKSKLALFAMNIHLKKYEVDLISKADSFFDISIDGLDFWKNLSFVHGHWLAPIYSDVPHDHQRQSSNFYDIVFAGNLYTPNNVEGINWFVNEVVPLLKAELPNLKIALVGSNPSAKIINIGNADECITVIANVRDPNDFISEDTILINPVQFGSGINIKAISMLFLANQVVSTSVGIAGLPIQFADVFFVADAADTFAASIIKIKRDHVKKDVEKREDIKKMFQPDILTNLLPIMTTKRLPVKK